MKNYHPIFPSSGQVRSSQNTCFYSSKLSGVGLNLKVLSIAAFIAYNLVEEIFPSLKRMLGCLLSDN